MIGKPGTTLGLVLRLAQGTFAAVSFIILLWANQVALYGNSAFNVLILAMGLQFLWNLGLALLDVAAMKRNLNLQLLPWMMFFSAGDWLFTMFSFSGACSSAGIAFLYYYHKKACGAEKAIHCFNYQLGIFFSFFSCFFMAVSAFMNMYLLFSALQD